MHVWCYSIQIATSIAVYLCVLTCVLVLTPPSRCRGVTTPHLLPPSWIRAHAWIQYKSHQPYLATWYLFLYLDIILGNEHRARDSPPSHPEHRHVGWRSPVTRTNTTTNTRWTIYLTCYPFWQLHKRQASDPQLTTHPTRASCGGPVCARPPAGGAAIHCNESNTATETHSTIYIKIISGCLNRW